MTPVAAWFTYSLVVGVLVGLSAQVMEVALRAWGRAGRWAWAGGMAATVLLPLGAVVGSLEWAAGAVPTGPVAVIPLAPLAVEAESGGGGVSLDGILLVGWVVLAGGCLTYLRWLYRSLARHGGLAARLAGVWVLVTKALGPAVYGVRRARILVPEWTLGLDTRLRRLMVLHEGEHARAGDSQLVLGALVLVAAVPWNVALWWQLSRLREAVELDCDARVLGRVADRASYGGLLLEVGWRRSSILPGVALVERQTMLERRIRRMTAVFRPDGRRAVVLGAVALVLLTLAAATRAPSSAPVRSAVPAGQDTLRPTFTPFTIPPRLKNREEVARALEQSYPAVLRDAGIGGEAIVWVFIDEKGAVRRALLEKGTGYPALDEAALDVARLMGFTPAYNRDTVVPVWVSIPIRFAVGEKGRVEVVDTGRRAEPPTSGERPAPARRQDPSDLGRAPTFTPFTVPPRLVNQAEVASSLQSNYPPALRDAGIGGDVTVWFFIAADGRVLKSQVGESSSYPALDEAALRVADTMRFTPAYNRDEAVPVWISIPIRFAVK